MGPFSATVTAYLNALNFGGQDTRGQFWGLIFGLVLACGTLALLASARPDLAAAHLAAWGDLAEMVRSRSLPGAVPKSLTPATVGGVVLVLFTVLAIVAATVRRLRDARKPKKLWLLLFLPGPGTLALAWCLARPTFDPTPPTENASAYRDPGRSWLPKRRAKTTHGVFRNRMNHRRRQAARERAEAARINPFLT